MVKNSAPTAGLPVTPATSKESDPSKLISGLPTQHTNGHPYYYDVHMDTISGSTVGIPDIRMATGKGYTTNEDARMETARGGTTLKHEKLQSWQKELLESSEVKRKATVAQLCEYYH
jgi:cell cycle protein kinase DBF2